MSRTEEPLPLTVAAKKKVGNLNLYQVFEAAKKTLAVHSKLCIRLVKIYQKVEFDSFFTEFVNLLKICLVVGEKHPQVERCLSFVASFTTCDKRLKEEKAVKKVADKEETGEEQDKEKEHSDAQGVPEEDEDVDEFLIKMIQFLVNIHEAQSSAVRYRVCQLINRILNSMGRAASIDDDLFNTIYDTMLERLMDKKPAVRVQAIHALNRLQDPTNKDCPVIKAYRYHLSMDPASEVRRAALCCTSITFQTLPDVLQRTRDKNNLVRRQAYLVLAEKVHLRSLQISQRVRLLSDGLNDRSDVVRVTVQKTLLNSWLRFANGSVLELLTCLDVEASTKVAKLALDALFKDVPAATLVQAFGLLDVNKLLPLDQLKPENALYWKCLAKHLKKEEADEELDFILPDLSAFCKYIEAFALDSEPIAGDDEYAVAVRHLEKQFVLQQLIRITSCYDLGDEVGRKSLLQMVGRMLVCRDLTETSIAVLVKAFGRLYPPTSRVLQLAEIISDIREVSNDGVETAAGPEASGSSPQPKQASSLPPTPTPISEDEARAIKIKAAKVRLELNEAREELESCVRSLDLDRAQELKLRLNTLQEQHNKLQQELVTPVTTPQAVRQPESEGDETLRPTHDESEEQQQMPPSPEEEASILSQCLIIVCEMLRNPDIKTLSPVLHSLHDNLVLPCLKNQDTLIRKLSVRALGLLCIISKDLTHKHLPLFLQISQLDTEVVQIAAVRAVFDMLLIHGMFHLAVSEQPTTAANDTDAIISVLAKRLEDDEGEVRSAVAMGLCKLFFTSRIHCPKLLSKLVLLWYSPLTEEDTHLRQMLGAFFPVYASKGSHHQEVLSSSFIKTIRTLIDVPPRSPFADVDIDDVCSFFMSLTSPAILCEDAKSSAINVHDSLVFTLCGEMLAHPSSALTQHLSRALRLVVLTPNNFTNLRQVHGLLSKVMERLRGSRRVVVASLEKFSSTVTELLKQAPAKEDTPLDHTTESCLTSGDVHDSSNAVNKTAEGTFARRKRRLYSNQSSSDLLSSEAESEAAATTNQKMGPIASGDSDQTHLDQTVKEENSCATGQLEGNNPAASDHEIHICSSGDLDSKDAFEEEQRSLLAADLSDTAAPEHSDDNTARQSDAETQSSGIAADAVFKPASKMPQLQVVLTRTEWKKGNKDASTSRSPNLTPVKKQRTTRNSIPDSSPSRRSSTASRVSRRAAVRASVAEASTDDELPQNLPSPRGRHAAVPPTISARPSASTRRSSRGKSLHCAERSSSSSSASPPRPVAKKHRGAHTKPEVSSISPASSVRSTRSTRSSTASDASSRRSLRSRNTTSPATSPATAAITTKKR